MLASRSSLNFDRAEHVFAERLAQDNISHTRSLRSLIGIDCLVDISLLFWWSLARAFPAPLPRIPEPLATVALPNASILVVFLPVGNRRVSKDIFPPVLATRQRLDSRDHTAPQSMDRRDATSEREGRFVCGHPSTILQRRQWATIASPLANGPLDSVRLIECDGLVHIISVSVLIWLGEFLVNTCIDASLRNLVISREVSGSIAGKSGN